MCAFIGFVLLCLLVRSAIKSGSSITDFGARHPALVRGGTKLLIRALKR